MLFVLYLHHHLLFSLFLLVKSCNVAVIVVCSFYIKFKFHMKPNSFTFSKFLSHRRSLLPLSPHFQEQPFLFWLENFLFCSIARDWTHGLAHTRLSIHELYLYSPWRTLPFLFIQRHTTDTYLSIWLLKTLFLFQRKGGIGERNLAKAPSQLRSKNFSTVTHAWYEGFWQRSILGSPSQAGMGKCPLKTTPAILNILPWERCQTEQPTHLASPCHPGPSGENWLHTPHSQRLET